MNLTDVLDIENSSIVSIVGAGGKTTLMFQLAQELKDKGRVLVTTTTKIYVPDKRQFDYLVIGEDSKKFPCGQDILEKKHCISGEALGNSPFTTKNNEIYPWFSRITTINKGIWVYGEGINEDNKLTSVGDNELRKIIEAFHYVLIEADGSKGKPLKGWRDDEPVISEFTTCTIGVLSGQTLGMNINEKNVHRLENFPGKLEGIVSEEDLIEVIFNPKGMFNNVKGNKVLFINSIDDEEIYKRNCGLISEIINKNRRRNFLNGFIIGSLKKKAFFKIEI